MIFAFTTHMQDKFISLPVVRFQTKFSLRENKDL